MPQSEIDASSPSRGALTDKIGVCLIEAYSNTAWVAWLSTASIAPVPASHPMRRCSNGTDAAYSGISIMRVLIVDDHRIVASGCRALFADDPDIDILEAFDAEGGERVFDAQHPDICVLDINLPTVSGFELARRILGRDPSARIIMFSMNDDPVFAARAIEVGAKGYVSKSGDPQDLVEAIREVAKGGAYLPPAMARSIAFSKPSFAQSPLARLTAREMEILRLLSAGKSLSEIAWLVHSSYKTVANTSSIMRQKLGVRTSAELVRLAIENRVA